MIWYEKAFEEKMRPHIDDIYKKSDGLKSINRYERDKHTTENMKVLDIDLGVDTILKYDDGSIITVQEKTRKYYYRNFNDFTFEYYNDPKTKSEGEWFKLAAQMYFFGYANEKENGYYKYWLIDVLKLRLFIKQNIGIDKLKIKYLHQNKPPAKANFFGIPFNLFDNDKSIIIRKG